MKVVLEGPDNAGKTTLATSLRKMIPELRYHHPGGRPNSLKDEETDIARQLELAKTPGPCLLDRVTCISQQVYNPEPIADWGRQLAVAELLEVPDVVVVYCRPPNEVLMDIGNFTWRPEETEEHRQKIISRQHEFIERYDGVMLQVPCLYYNWRDQAHSDMLRKMLHLGLTGSDRAATWFKDVIAYGGRR